MDRTGRMAGVDFTRALACLMVLVHHLVLRLNFDKLSPEQLPAFEFSRFGNYGVSLFFVLSGFLLARPFWSALDKGAPLPSLKIYALRRAARILPGYWVALTVGFVLSFALYKFPLNSELIGRYLAGFFLMSQWHWRTFFPVQSDGPLWSIGFEVTCYVLLPICFLMLFTLRARIKSALAMRIAWLGVIGFTVVAHWLVVKCFPLDDAARGWEFGLQGGAKAWMPRYNPIGFFAIFAIGTLAAGVRTILPTRSSLLYDLVALLALVAGAAQLSLSIGGSGEGYGWLSIPYRFPWMPLCVAVVLCALPTSVFLGRLLDNPVSRFIATVSFGMYIWQDIVISLIVRIDPTAFGIGSDDMLTGWLTWSPIAVAITILVGTLSYFVIERPVIHWARNLEGTPPTRFEAVRQS
ncbi:acyltransferase family protein [Rhizobium tubonense]|uniref:Acyltransferase n=1 Tax=Rhizobium tubonense TaxID=484088 RepID=A0A2W4CVZ0_9HYPH|nr:acyltransferase [Rhizobium tubonense]PZM09554.1 acyltransferase [Rhizobium tubonense]